jgi:predicted DCC family thiol-disulfide oxidoreductase YuxK
VHTEITDNVNTKQDWVCYDAECALCVRWAERLRAVLERRGFRLLPLQSPAVRAALPVPESEWLAEMRVITRGGDIFGGADALVYLSRTICQPIFALTQIPGATPLLRSAYRFLARHRRCQSGACRPRPDRAANLVHGLPLLILALAAGVIGKSLPPWLYMWTLAFALFAGCKWLCFRNELAKGTRPGLGRSLGFLFGWIGMDAEDFLAKDNAPETPRATEWLFASLKIFVGAILIWVAARMALTVNPLLAGWTGLLGFVFLLHFGFFHLLALAWRAAGVHATPLMRAPLLARSLGEFWGRRWNTAFHQLTTGFLFQPLRGVVEVRTATMLAFLASGLTHDLVISVPARGGYGLPTLYFLLQGAGVLFQHTKIARQCHLDRGIPGRLFTILVAAGPAFWLFHPPFIRHVILPMLHAFGAT